MKKYYSLKAKILLFLAAILFGFITVASASTAAVCLIEGIYEKNEDLYREENLQRFLWEYVDALAWDPEAEVSGNLSYRIFDQKGELIAQSAETGEEVEGNYIYVYRKSYYTRDCIYVDADSELSWAASSLSPMQVMEDSGHPVAEVEESLAEPLDETGKETTEKTTSSEYLLLQVAVKKSLPVQDSLCRDLTLIHLIFVWRYPVILMAVLGSILTLICFGYLLAGSGHRAGTEELCSGPLERIPIDVMAAGWLGLSLLAGLGIGESFSIMDCYGTDDFLSRLAAGAVLLSAVVILEGCITLGLCLTIASRFKKRTLIRESLTWRILLLAGKLCRKLGRMLYSGIKVIPLMWKVLAAFAVLCFLEFSGIVLFTYDGTFAMIWFIEKVLMLVCLFWLTEVLGKLKKGGEALAAGDLTYKTDTRHMIWDLKEHGENLNSIGQGMNAAVSEKVKSERMKTELITNVSHDIKTPLTSIINYTSLIAEESTENEKVKEYTAVLIRQSDRLKRLIEDLVEASKASTGNLDVETVPCDAAVFVEQAGGEYEEKLQRSDLTLVTSVPQEEIRILADGRRMWRVFDNLMNNICKYSQRGTRVYLSLERQGDRAVFTFRNVSREALNISPEELMERFVRGDASRNTEGNGLGLSIAKSMAELQGGTLNLAIDGDLFKAVLSFPVVDA